jgi:hypothetical protein
MPVKDLYRMKAGSFVQMSNKDKKKWSRNRTLAVADV